MGGGGGGGGGGRGGWKFEDGEAGLLVEDIFTLPLEILGKALEIPQNCVTPLEIRHDFFLIIRCKLHIVFNKFLEILLTVSSIHPEVPILLILFLFSNMLLSKIQTPK